MDKETLSNYGWIVICILVLSVMIALATPFGSFIRTAVESATQGLFDVSQKAGAIAGLDLPDQSFSDGTSGEVNKNKLTAPEISIDGTILTIEPVANATGYEIYNGDILLYTTSRNTADLAVWLTAVGDYIIGVKAVADGYTASESKTTTYSITTEITYHSFTIKSSNRSKVGYTGEANEALVIPATFYDESEGKWYKVTKINSWAFENCTGLTSIALPDSLTQIDMYAFLRCSNLSTITISSSLEQVGSQAFQNCTNLKTVVYEGRLEQWLNIAFDDNPCQNGAVLYFNTNELVAEIVIPDSFTSIGMNAFKGCSSLTIVNISANVNSIGYCAFRNCTNLTSVTFGENSQLTDIGRESFYGCKSLSVITIPASVTSIGGTDASPSGAFEYCTNLKTVIYEGTLEQWLNISFGGYLASPCGNGASLYINTSELVDDIVIPDSVTSIGTGAFFGCTSLTSVDIHDGVINICDAAFRQCTNLNNTSLGKGVTSIGKWAFYLCNNLRSVTFENPNGWWYASSSTATSGTYLTADDLTNTSTAITYLTTNPRTNYYWFRNES